MLRIRTIFGLQAKDPSYVDGYNPVQKNDVRCWRDAEGNLYGATLSDAQGKCDTETIYIDGGVELTRVNQDFDDLRELIEQQTGITGLEPVDASGVFPTIRIDGHQERDYPPKHWASNDVLRKHGDRWGTFLVLPLVIPKKYTKKMTVKEVNREMMKETVKAELKEWSVI
jgi:hypothetical protein